MDYYTTYVPYEGDVFEVRIWPNEAPDPYWDPYKWSLYPYFAQIRNPIEIRDRNYDRLSRSLFESHPSYPKRKLGYNTLAEAKDAVRRAINRLKMSGKRWGIEWNGRWYRMTE